MVEMARKIIFRDPDTGKIISRKAWENLLIEGRVEVTSLQQGSRAYRVKGKIQDKKVIKKLLRTEAYFDAPPKYTTEKITAEVKGFDRDFFLVYETQAQRNKIIAKLKEEYDFKTYRKSLTPPTKKQLGLVTFIERNN